MKQFAEGWLSRAAKSDGGGKGGGGGAPGMWIKEIF